MPWRGELRRRSTSSSGRASARRSRCRGRSARRYRAPAACPRVARTRIPRTVCSGHRARAQAGGASAIQLSRVAARPRARRAVEVRGRPTALHVRLGRARGCRAAASARSAASARERSPAARRAPSAQRRRRPRRSSSVPTRIRLAEQRRQPSSPRAMALGRAHAGPSGWGWTGTPFELQARAHGRRSARARAGSPAG